MLIPHGTALNLFYSELKSCASIKFLLRIRTMTAGTLKPKRKQIDSILLNKHLL